MSMWWKVTVKTPQGGEDSTVVMAADHDGAHAKAVSEFSREYSHVSVIGVELYADDENDETIGGFNEREGLSYPAPTQPRLTT
ncbi:MAG: hypothetical protein WC246_02475 [Candidatus Paceibacterota bacterium]|jgi:hypothetical protein